MKKYSYNYGRPVAKLVVPTLAESVNLFNKLRTSGKIFRADFIKRTNGEKRTMVCRCNVKKYLKGGKAAYHFGDKGLLSVYEYGKGYRSITIDNLHMIKFGGVVYLFNTEAKAGHYPVEQHFAQDYGRTYPASNSPMYAPLTTEGNAPLHASA